MDRRAKSFTLQGLAEYTNTRLIGDPTHLIFGVADLESAASTDASFLAKPKFTKANPKYLQDMRASKAGVICIDSETQKSENRNYLVSDNPSVTFQLILELFHPIRKNPSGFEGIHPTAVVHPTAYIGKGVILGPYVVVDEHVFIGDETFVGAGAYIGPYCKIGHSSVIHPRVVIREECIIGNRVILQPGAVIGSCGFGYATDEKGIHTKLNQVGNVTIEDDVEIGANTTVDRARFKSSIIRKGTKIDNLVQIAHGVEIGAYNIIAGQSGIAGSSTTENHVVIGGQVAVAGHLRLARGVMVAGKSGVSKSLPSGKYGGIPVLPLAEYNRNAVFLRNIETYVKQIKELEKRLQRLEEEENG